MSKLPAAVGISISVLCAVDPDHWTLWATVANSWLTLSVIVHAITRGR